MTKQRQQLRHNSFGGRTQLAGSQALVTPIGAVAAGANGKGYSPCYAWLFRPPDTSALSRPLSLLQRPYVRSGDPRGSKPAKRRDCSRRRVSGNGYSGRCAVSCCESVTCAVGGPVGIWQCCACTTPAAINFLGEEPRFLDILVPSDIGHSFLLVLVGRIKQTGLRTFGTRARAHLSLGSHLVLPARLCLYGRNDARTRQRRSRPKEERHHRPPRALLLSVASLLYPLRSFSGSIEFGISRLQDDR